MKLTRINYNGGYLWVDKESDIIGWFYREDTKEVFFDDHIKRLEVINKQRKFRFKIVAQTNLDLPNIPYVEIGEEGIELLAELKYKEQSEEFEDSDEFNLFDKSILLKIGFIEGYKAAKEKYAYTESDMETAVCFGMALEMLKFDSGRLSNTEEFKGFLETLNQPPNEIEIEMVGITNGSDKYLLCKLMPVAYIKEGKSYLKVKR